MSQALQTLLQRIEKPTSRGRNKWSARCPAHDDRDPSLSVSLLDDGRILIHCFGGCDPVSILASVDMSMTDLFPDRAIDHQLRGATPWIRRQRRSEEKKQTTNRTIMDIASAMRARGERLTPKQMQEEREAFLRSRRSVNG